MKKTLLLSLLLSAAPAAAFAADLAVETPAPVVASSSDYSGYVEAAVTGADLSWDYDYGYSYDGNVYGLSLGAALAYKLDANWQIQADLNYDTFKYDEDYSEVYTTGYGALHANYYVDNYAIGAFGGVSQFNGDYQAFGGVEGQLAIDSNLIVTGQLGYIGAFSGEAYDYDEGISAAFGQIGVKYFIADNFEIGASVGGAQGDYYYEDDVNLWTASLEAAYQFDNSPISVFASYSYSQNDATYYDADYSTLKVGARFSFDGESLKSQALTGASHKVFDLTTLSRTW